MIGYVQEAIGYILSYGYQDVEALQQGSDLKVHMKKESEKWYIQTIETRQRCSRQVTADGDRCL